MNIGMSVREMTPEEAELYASGKRAERERIVGIIERQSCKHQTLAAVANANGDYEGRISNESIERFCAELKQQIEEV